MAGSVLVTGAGSGIGRALAVALVREWGVRCISLLDLDAAALLTLRDELQAAGADVLVCAADVRREPAVSRAFAEHAARFGGLDTALLCAGIGERGDFLGPAPDAALLATLEVDLTAVLACTRLAAKAMVAAGRGGRIVSIASAAGIFPVTVGPVYAAAKAGVVHLTRSLAPRLAAHGIQVATVCPQYVDTPLVQAMLRDEPEVARLMMGPLFGQPLLSPRQVVDVVLQVLTQPLPAQGRKVPFREAYAGAGCVWLLLQSGKVVDPFAAGAGHKALQGARVANSSSSGTRSSGGSSGSSSSEAQQPMQPASALSAASAASMRRFSDPAVLRTWVDQPLTGSYRKLQVTRLSVRFSEAVQAVTVPLPAPGALPPGSLLLRRLWAGINASDVNYTSGRYHGSAAAATQALPYDAGFESVSLVAAAAGDVAAAFPAGTPVATMEAGFSEWAVSPARRVLRVPSCAPEVVALLTSGLTASLALEEVGGLRLPGSSSDDTSGGSSSSSSSSSGGGKPRTVLVTAAAGGTGMFAVQLARLAGCHVIATCGGPAKAALLRELGADRVIDYRAESVKAVLKAEYPSGVDLVYESVGGDMFATCVDALAPRGRLIIIGMMSAYSSGWQPSQHPGLAEKLLWKSASVAGFFLLRYAPQWQAHLGRLCQLVARGQLAVALDEARFVGLPSVGGAVARLQSGASQGKVVVQLARDLPCAAGSRL